MTASITIYGSGDDLIEICGDVAEEIYDIKMLGATIELSDGTVLATRFTREGVWRIRVDRVGSASCTIEPAVGPDDDNYSDRATLTGDLRWVRATVGDATTEHPI